MLSTCCRAPWVKKWSNLPIGEKLVITWPYSHPPDCPVHHRQTNVKLLNQQAWQPKCISRLFWPPVSCKAETAKGSVKMETECRNCSLCTDVPPSLRKNREKRRLWIADDNRVPVSPECLGQPLIGCNVNAMTQVISGVAIGEWISE